MVPPPSKVKKLATPVNMHKKRISARKAELPLPKPFEVPANFSPNVQVGLESNSLNGKTRAKFITMIAQAIYRFFILMQ